MLPEIKININNRRFPLSEYMRVRRERKLYNDWKFMGYGQTTNEKFYASKSYDFFMKMYRKEDGYYIGIGKNNKWVGDIIGVMITQNEAIKMLKIAQDFMAVYNWTWEQVVAEFDKEVNLVESKSRGNVNADLKANLHNRPDEHLTDSEIREIYRELYSQINQKYPMTKPPLIIMHKRNDAYAYYSRSKKTIHVESYLPEMHLRSTLMHELCHALVAQRKLESPQGHGYYFLQFYKVMSGRDYFDNQDSVIIAEKLAWEQNKR